MKVVTQTTANGQTTSTTHTLDFTYDASGSPVAVTYDGTTYYYALNLQGDVLAILDGSGNRAVYYVYDAWGNVQSVTGTMASTLGQYNPLRYRGYVYDTETESYYLQSRYYNPTLGRFLNADTFTSTGQGILGNNMFAYGNNNPVNNCDPDGAYTRGQIHNFVLEQIIQDMRCCGRNKLSMSNTTIYYNGYNFLGGWGFCDLYDAGSGEVWELKRVSCNKKRAEKQLEKYTTGRLRIKKELELKIGGHLFSGKRQFIKKDDGGTYHIIYWQGENGILWYDYTYVKNDARRMSDALAIGGLVIGISGMAINGLSLKTPTQIDYQNAA